MSEIFQRNSSRIPSGIKIDLVTIDRAKADQMDAEGLFVSTSKHFERIRKGFPIGYPNGGKALAHVERAFQSVRGRSIRPIGVLPQEWKDPYNDRYRLISPVAQLSVGSEVFCVTADAEDPEVTFGHPMPFVARVWSDADGELELHKAEQVGINIEEGRVVNHFVFESLGVINPNTELDSLQKMGLAAVNLALRASSGA